MLIFALLLRVASPQSRFTPIPFEQRKEMLGDRVEELTAFCRNLNIEMHLVR